MDKQFNLRFSIKVYFKGWMAYDDDVFDSEYGSDEDRPCTSYISLYRDSVIANNRKAFTAGIENIIAIGSRATNYFEWISDSYDRFTDLSESEDMDVIFMLHNNRKEGLDDTVMEICTTRQFTRVTPMPYPGVSDASKMLATLRTYVDNIGMITNHPKSKAEWALYTQNGVCFSGEGSYEDTLSSLYMNAMSKCKIIFIDTEAIDWEDESGILSVTEKKFYTQHKIKCPIRVLY